MVFRKLRDAFYLVNKPLKAVTFVCFCFKVLLHVGDGGFYLPLFFLKRHRHGGEPFIRNLPIDIILIDFLDKAVNLNCAFFAFESSFCFWASSFFFSSPKVAICFLAKSFSKLCTHQNTRCILSNTISAMTFSRI